MVLIWRSLTVNRIPACILNKLFLPVEMSVKTEQIHRRKSSKDEEENADIIVAPAGDTTPAVTIGPSPRTRTMSTPHNHGHTRSASMANGHPPSAGPFRTTFANGVSPVSPLRSSFSVPMNGHGRTRSISSFTPSAPSPLGAAFPPHPPLKSPTMLPPAITPSHSAPEQGESQGAPAAKHSRRHSRLHSRNLSIFFPRPGSLPESAISEDGSQELEVPVDEEAPLIPAASTNVSLPGARRQPITPLGQGFTFGGRPPSSAGLPTPELMSPRSASSSTSRRGHHHKHSLSHNFFSFLEPGSGLPPMRDEELHTQPTPVPLSPWGPISAFPDSAAATSTSSGFKLPPVRNGHAFVEQEEPEEISPAAVASSIGQFLLGAWLWVTGQQVGSLATTGLGYWIVFDSFGVALSGVVPGWLASAAKSGQAAKEKEKVRRPYGNGRLETVVMFAQAVYLMFSAVYVCKETVEHVLLSLGGGHHHHHGGDEEEGIGIDFPIFMSFFTFVSLFATAYFFDNHTKLVNITGNRIPSLSSLLRSIWSPSRLAHDPPPTTVLARLLSNPFVASPLFFCVAILCVALFIPYAQHPIADLILAAVIAFVTFKIAYRACLVLGTVLLQTSPPRGMASGKMEAFLRAMREVERHPQVVHLPAPHVWQLTPSLASAPLSKGLANGNGVYREREREKESLVVTLELHVKEDLGDDDVLKLTRWAWERVVSAIGSLKDFREEGEEGGPEVTVGVVRG
ncbi:unnamed protein product [Cyclocybe aegerita]|uniref:Cation efflux protein transmembrane domain-containing protein n=1 Tax=Cyclocybe aegerita TaxID=1973307 RepID=A0A8S0WIX6_CYCAE|nr:unnamed protein product [Cyclocybe aegerita]